MVFIPKKEKYLEREYALQEISFDQNEWIFMYSDGFYDQFGGEKGSPWGLKNSKKYCKML